MPRKIPDISLVEMLRHATQELKASVVLPNMLTYEPHPKQIIFHESEKREKLFLGGNRSGKTVANVAECCFWLTKKHPYREDVNKIDEPIRGRFVGVSFLDGMDKIAIPLFKAFLPKTELIGGDWNKSWDNYKKILTLANGSFLEFMSYEQDLEKFAGTSRHFIAYDEEPPQHIFNECRMRIVDTKGSWWCSMTPVDGMTWIYDVLYTPFKKGERPLTLVIEIESIENPHVDGEEIDLATQHMSDEERDARKKGSFIELGGLVYKSFTPAIHKRYGFVPTEDMTVWASYDHGWRHPAAWLWHAVEKNGHITTFHEIVLSERTVEELADMVKEYELLYLKPKGIEVTMRPADPATNQKSGINGMSILQLYAEHGLYLATEGIQRSIDVGLDKIQSYLKIDPKTKTPFWQYTPDCTRLEWQMQHLHWDKFRSKKLEYEKAPRQTVADKEDDAPDSLRYFMSFMPDLYFPKAQPEKMFPPMPPEGLAQYVNPWNAKAGKLEEVLRNTGGEYRVYEGGTINALENY